MLYHFYDLQHALLTPARIMAELVRTVTQNPWNPLSYTQMGRTIAATAVTMEPTGGSTTPTAPILFVGGVKAE